MDTIIWLGEAMQQRWWLVGAVLFAAACCALDDPDIEGPSARAVAFLTSLGIFLLWPVAAPIRLVFTIKNRLL